MKYIKGETAKTSLAKFPSHYSLPPDHQGGTHKKLKFPMLQSGDKMKTKSCEIRFCCLTLYEENSTFFEFGFIDITMKYKEQ